MSRDQRHSGISRGPRPGGAGAIAKDTRGPAWPRRLLFTLVLFLVPPIVFFAVLEGGLRLAGYGHPTAFFTDLPGREACTTNQDFGRRFFPPNLVRTTQPCVLPKVKAPGSYRIFVLGGSAALGIPDPAFGFSRVLEAMLTERYPGIRFEVVNAAMTAINSHVVLPIATECAGKDPDLLVVYLGNNEVIGPYGAATVFSGFSPHLALIRAAIHIKATRTGQLLTQLLYKLRSKRDEPTRWGAMEMFRENRIRADDPRMQAVYSHFARNLADICRAAQRAGAATLLCTVGVNLRDNPPFGSLHRLDLSSDDAEHWQRLYDSGVALSEAGQYAEAIVTLRSAAALDDHYADLHYHLAGCLWSTGEYAAARDEYVLANEWDALRFRADGRINATIRQVAAQNAGRGVRLVDVEEACRTSPRTLHATPGEGLFFEHVHMNWEGTYLLASMVYRQIVALLPDEIRQRGAGSQASAAGTPEPLAGTREPALGAGELAADELTPPAPERCAERLVFTPWDRYRQCQLITGMMSRPPFSDQIDHERTRAAGEATLRSLHEALTNEAMRGVLAQYQATVPRLPGDLYVPQRLARLLRENGDAAGAERVWRGLLARVPVWREWQSELARVLSDQSKNAEAIDILRRVVRANPGSAEERNNLGLALATAGRTREAIAEYRRAVRIDPQLGEAHCNLGMALAQDGQEAEALEQYLHALEIDPRLVDAHVNAAAICERDGDLEQAIGHYREALRQHPAMPEVIHRFGLALAGAGRHREAIEQFRAALELSPDVPEIRANLAAAYANAGDAAAAIAQYRELIRLRPEDGEACFWLGQLLSEQPRGGREAVAMLRRAIELTPGWVPPLHRLADILATHPDPTIRQGEEAVRLANRACDLTGYGDPAVLETAAAAQAEIGRFDRALQLLERAESTAGAAAGQALHRRIAMERALYTSQRPLREQPGDGSQ